METDYILNSFERISEFCLRSLSKSGKLIQQRLLESYGVLPEDDYGLNLNLTAYGSCSLLFSLLMIWQDQKATEHFVENAIRQLTDEWDHLEMDDVFKSARDNDPDWYDFVMNVVSKESVNDYKKIYSKILAVPDQITIKPGMRYKYVMNISQEYWDIVVDRMINDTGTNENRLFELEANLDVKFLNKLFGSSDMPDYEQSKGIFLWLSFLFRSLYDEEKTIEL